jgi:hypothetical protein
MDKDQLKHLNPEEAELMLQLTDILPWGNPECDLLPLTYTNIKMQGSAFSMDVMQLASLGIPIYEMLSHIRQQPPSQIIQHLHSGSINFYEIKKLLEHFNQNMELYFSL